MVEALALVVQLLLIGAVGQALVTAALAILVGLVLLGILALIPWAID